MPPSKTDSASSTDPRISDPVARTALAEEVGTYIMQLIDDDTHRDDIYPAVQARYPQLSERVIMCSILVTRFARIKANPGPLTRALTGS